MRFRRQSASCKTGFRKLAWIAVLACCTLGGNVRADDAPAVALSTCRVVIAAKFTLPQVSQPISGAKDTVFAAAWLSTTDGGKTDAVRFLSKDEFGSLGLDWSEFAAKTTDAASAEFSKLEPELIRDRNEVIECAVLHAKRPVDNITSTVLAPDFLKRFAPLFGSKLLIVIPDRQTIYLFPKLASRYQDYGERILSRYRKSECPVSREVFELSVTGLRAVGAYEEP